jgi:hypothetical protein
MLTTGYYCERQGDDWKAADREGIPGKVLARHVDA